MAFLSSMSSSKGLEMAASAAIWPRSSPWALPDPIMAMPICPITFLTSAKSTLINPGRVMISAMPCTAPKRTLLAALKAFSTRVSSPKDWESLSLGTVISESTNLLSSSMPFSATCARFSRSHSNGLVTTATVNMPISLATSATMGAAPVPVPPPMPAVMNSMSAPCNTFLIVS